MATEIKVRFTDQQTPAWKIGRSIFRSSERVTDVRPEGNEYVVVFGANSNEEFALSVLKRVAGIEVVQEVR